MPTLSELVNEFPNKLPFRKVVGNDFGRKIAYTREQYIDSTNVVDVLSKGLTIFNSNKPAIRYLRGYMKGDQIAHYRTKSMRDDVCNYIVENHAYEIVQFKTAQTYGEPVQYNSLKDDDTTNKAVDILNDYMRAAFKDNRDIIAGEWKSAVGTSFKAIQLVKNSDVPFRIIVPTPLDTFVIYSADTNEPVMAVQEKQDTDNRTYYLCFTKTMTYKVMDSEIVDSALHTYGDIPIVETPNNHERISDIELVIDILDGINNIQSNRVDSIEQFVQSFIKFVNCQVDAEQFQRMKEMGAIIVQSNNGDNKADVDIMSQELNQTQTQTTKDDLWNNAMNILAIPNRENNGGSGDRAGAVSLRSGWDFAKQRAKLVDSYVREAELKLARVVNNILVMEKNEYNLGVMDYDAQINHSPTDNMLVKAEALQLMLKAGIHPLIAIKTCGLWGDSEKTFMLSRPYMDALYKTIDDVQEQEQKAQEILQKQMKETS